MTFLSRQVRWKMDSTWYFCWMMQERAIGLIRIFPGTDDLDAEIRRLEGKKKAGAQFVQTQPIYDIKQAEDFLACAKDLDLPILFGIVPLKSFKMANYLNDKVPGITIPPKVLSQMETGGRETGLAISKEIVTALREIHAAGAHLMPVNDIDAIPYIVGD